MLDSPKEKDSTKEKTERERAVKKLIKKWRTSQETKGKASVLLEKNPDWKTGQRKVEGKIKTI